MDVILSKSHEHGIGFMSIERIMGDAMANDHVVEGNRKSKHARAVSKYNGVTR